MIRSGIRVPGCLSSVIAWQQTDDEPGWILSEAESLPCDGLRITQVQESPGACGSDIHLLPLGIEELLLLFGRKSLGEEGIGEVAFTQTHDIDMVPLQPFS